MDGGNLGLIEPDRLLAEVGMVGLGRQRLGDLLGNPGPKLLRRCPGKGDDEKLSSIFPPLLEDVVHQPLHQHPGLSRPGGSGNQ